MMKILLAQEKLLFRTIASVMVFLFGTNMVLAPVSFAQVDFLPAAGSMVNMTPKFDPMVAKGIKLYPDNPFKFDFIVDTGDMILSRDQIKTQGQKLASYFLASLTIPEKEMWVNLSPYEKSRIIPSAFGDTEMGKELLSEDYMLKQIMATALYPERQIGKEFWQRVYAQASREFGTTNVPVSTFNKVWIVPDEAVVYENAQLNSVFVVQSRLKVMLERDYLAANKNKAMEQYGLSSSVVARSESDEAVSSLSSKIIKEVVIPALEKEVNEGRNFAGLRQVFQSLILAAWYKKNLKDNVLAKGYVDRNKTLGVDTQDKQITEKIYKQYLRAYRKGVYNYIKEEVDPATQQMIPRKYFSGGFAATNMSARLTIALPQEAQSNAAMLADRAQLRKLVSISIVTLVLGAATLLPSGAQAAGYGTFLREVRANHVSVVEPDGYTINVTLQNFDTISRSLQAGDVVLDGPTKEHTVVSADGNIGLSGIVANLVGNASNAAPVPGPTVTPTVAPLVAPPPVATPTPPFVTPPSATGANRNIFVPPEIMNQLTINLEPQLAALKNYIEKYGSNFKQNYRSAINENYGLWEKRLGPYQKDTRVDDDIKKMKAILDVINPTPLSGGQGGPPGPPKPPGGALSLPPPDNYSRVHILPSAQMAKRSFTKKELVRINMAAIKAIEGPPHTVSGRGAIGPYGVSLYNGALADYQVLFPNVVINLFDPRDNYRVSEWYLNVRIPYLLRMFHLEDTVWNRLWAYNAGIGRLLRGVMPSETRKYLWKYARLTLKGSHGINQAMISNPAAPGGIDLEKLILNSKGTGGVRTAFSDPRILQMLLDAKGLFPQIQSIEPLTVSMVDMLLGFNAQANDAS